jgi:hypothetical protein
MKQIYYPFLFLSVFLAGCASGKRQLEHGNYDLAVQQAVKRLQQKPGHIKSSKVLKDAYRLAVETHFTKVESYDLSNDSYKWVYIAEEYRAIDNLNRIIREYPKYSRLLELTNVTEELRKSELEASKSYFNRGLELLQRNTREDARMAYYEFLNAARYDKRNNEIERMIAASREAGTLKVAIEFPATESNSYFIPTTDLFYAVINEARAYNFTFLRIVDPVNESYVPDQIIRMNFDEIFVGQVYQNQQIERFVKDSVRLGEVNINDSTRVPVYGPVEATLRTYTKTISSSGVLNLQRIDGKSGTLLNRSRIPANYNWTSKWADFRGDQRALNQNQLDLASRQEPPTPAPQWLFVQMSQPLLDQTMRIFHGTYNYLR